MALTVNKPIERASDMQTAKHRLYFNADKSALVHEGHPDASFLAAGVGDEVPYGMGVPDAPEADGDDSYESMTVAELKDYAAINEIDLTGLSLKAEIVAAIEEAEA